MNKRVGSQLKVFRSQNKPRSFLVVIVKKNWLPIIAKVLYEKLGMTCFGGGEFSDYLILNFVEEPEIIDKLIGMFTTIPNRIIDR